MQNICRSRLLFYVFYFILLVPFNLITKMDEYQDEDSYVYLNNRLHNIAECIHAVSTFDNDTESPVHLLKRRIESGYTIGHQDDILDVLEYSLWLLEQSDSDDVERQHLIYALDNAAQAIVEGFLAVNGKKRQLPFDLDDASFEEGDEDVSNGMIVRINVSTNISMNDSVSSNVGNIIKSGERFIHNFGQDNTFVGKRAGNFSTVGSNNTGIGADSLRVISEANRNTAVGKSALRDATIGDRNTAVGYRALRGNRSGSNNVAMGDSSLLTHTVGISNTTVGRDSLRNCVDGDGNAVLGESALFAMRSGNRNTAVGMEVANILTGGDENIFIGASAGSALTFGSNNIYIGNSGNQRELNAIRIGDSRQTACYIAGISGASVATTALTVFADATGKLGTSRSARKFKRNINEMSNSSDCIYALNPVTFSYNDDENQTRQFGLIAEEVDAVFPELVAYDNDGAPYTVRYEVLPVLLLNEVQKQKKDMQQQRQDIDMLLQAVRTLQSKTQDFIADTITQAIGEGFLEANAQTSEASVASEDNFLLDTDSSMESNDSIRLAVMRNISMVDSVDQDHGNIIKSGERFIHNFGTDNTFVGKRAGNFTTTSSNNTGIGTDALRALVTGNRNTAVGKSALRFNVIGARNVAIGYRAMRASRGAVDSVAIGDSALLFTLDPQNVVAIGRNALRNYNDSRGGCVAIGTSAGISVRSGNGNTFIGHAAGANLSIGDNNIYIGADAPSADTIESGVIRIGDANTTECTIKGISGSFVLSGLAVLVDANGQLGTSTSSRAFKHSIDEMSNESERIYELNPVTFVYNQDETATRQFGLIAEEVNAVFPELVAYDNDGAPYTVRYEVLPVLLLNEVQKQKKEISQLQQEVNDLPLLRKAIVTLQKKIQRFIEG